MRLKGSTELNIETHVLKGNLGKVRSRLQGIDLENGITVLALQPEIGKTYTFIEYCKDHPEKKIGYFAPTYKLLEEVESKLKESGLLNVVLLKGQDELCIRKDDHVSIWRKAKLSIGVFCNNCEYLSTCEYKKQFNHPDKNIILKASAYLGIDNMSLDKFDIIFVDETLKTFSEYSLALTKDDLEIANTVSDIDSIEDSNILYKVADGLDDFDTTKLNGLYENIVNKSMQSLPSIGNFTIFTKLLSNLKKSIKFLEWRRIYADCKLYMSDLDTYYEPHVYNLFRNAELIPVVLLDATFNQELFEDLLVGYDGEFGIRHDFDINIYYSKLSKIKSKVIKVNPLSWYPQSSLSKNVNIFNKLEKIGTLHKTLGLNVGIITSKRFMPKLNGFNVLTYGDQRGQNKLKECDVLIVLGTYYIPPKGIIDLYNKFYLTDLNEDDYFDLRDYHDNEISKAMNEIEEYIYDNPDGILQPSDASRLVPYEFMDMRRQACDCCRLRTYGDNEYTFIENIKFRLIESTMREDEMYQAIHRARLFSNNKTVYVFGIIPERIENEFKCYDIKINDLIADLESKVHKLRRKTTDIESYFKDGERISYIVGDIMRDFGYVRSSAYKKINGILEASNKWTKKSVKVDGIDGPVDVLEKRLKSETPH